MSDKPIDRALGNPPAKPGERVIEVDYLARVEGEGSLYLRFDGAKVADSQFKIFEPPRFFEALLRGRQFDEAPDITARICGICPVAYQMSAVHAVEAAFGVTVDGHVRELRRLLYCGEWIESHVLHIYMLHAPDFLGYPDVVTMAKDHRTAVERGLKLKKAGNTIVEVLGGRSIHPINVRVGGFYKLPDAAVLAALGKVVTEAATLARETVAWVASFPFPKLEQDYDFVALRHDREYPFNEGRIVSNRGLDIGAAEFGSHFSETQVPHSHALHARLAGHGAYLVGPMARYALNFDRLPASVQAMARDAGLDAVCRNPFQAIIVRAIEVLYACEEALRIIDAYRPGGNPMIDFTPYGGVGYAATEAPRGLLFHRYRVEPDGLIAEAEIIPPTSQNQRRIEQDLVAFAEANHAMADEPLRGRCEQLIRNYDPCISCATHFLRLTVDR